MDKNWLKEFDEDVKNGVTPGNLVWIQNHPSTLNILLTRLNGGLTNEPQKLHGFNFNVSVNLYAGNRWPPIKCRPR